MNEKPPRVYICYPYYENVEEVMDKMGNKVKERGMRIYKPLGAIEGKEKEANDAGMKNCNAMLAHFPKGFLALGSAYEVFKMLLIHKKPVSIWCDEPYMSNHYLTREIPNLFVRDTLEGSIEILENVLNKP